MENTKSIEIAFLEEEWDGSDVSFCTTGLTVHSAEVELLEEEWDGSDVSFCTTGLTVHSAEVTEAE